MGSYKQVVKELSVKLRGVTHIPVKEVEILLQYLLDKNTIWLHMNYDKPCECEKELVLLVDKRATNYPLEYITKKATFYGEIFQVQEGVLIPRPETELLVEKVEKHFKNQSNIKILEIGVGSGIISVMLAKLLPNSSFIAVDINTQAIDLAKQNAHYHGVENKITFIHSDLFDTISHEIEFDCVVSNPPYIANDYKLPSNVKFEPSNALFGGDVGDELLKSIIIETYNRKIPYLVCEMGYDQKKPLKDFIEQNTQVKSLQFYSDYEKFDRGFEVEFKV